VQNSKFLNIKIKIMESILERIVVVGFPPDQYHREFTDKKQIVVHHTVSGDKAEGDIAWWLSTPERIATAIIIDRLGVPWQCFSTRFWGSHIGVKGHPELEKQSIGIELDSWGPLMQTKTGKWFAVRYDVKTKRYVPNNFNPEMPVERIQFYPNGFRGFEAYEKYTSSQLNTLKDLLRYLGKKWTISLAYNSDMWDVNERALAGTEGVWTHVSFRSDKSDCHPYSGLVSVLSSL
jgi:hypothetical protein